MKVELSEYNLMQIYLAFYRKRIYLYSFSKDALTVHDIHYFNLNVLSLCSVFLNPGEGWDGSCASLGKGCFRPRTWD